jgi:hypothetical protein
MRLLREALYGEGAEFRVLVANLPCVLELIRIAPHLHRVEAVELVDGYARARRGTLKHNDILAGS